MAIEQSNDYIVSDSPAISDELQADLEAIANLVHNVAHRQKGEGTALLALLRILEASHREVCDGLFQEALPESRHQLYTFLKDMESEGGWPYIPRMKLRKLIVSLNVSLQDALEEAVKQPNKPAP